MGKTLQGGGLMTDVLSTPRLVLRPFVPEDGAEMFRMWASDPQVTRFLR